MPGFVHLHTHSHFSFMDGVPAPGDLVARAGELGMESLAVTDHQGLYGAVRFYQKALKAGIKPIVGCEVCVEPAGAEAANADLPPEQRLAPPPPVGSARARGEGFHLTLLARDMDGYRGLCRLLSRAHVRSGDEPSVVTLADLERHGGHLIGLSGCGYGEAASAVRAARPGRAARALKRLASCFPRGDFYVELTDALTPGSARTVATLSDLADTLGLHVVATNDVHYIERRQARLHDVLASAGALMELPGPFERPNAELWMKSAGEMRRLFAKYPRACDNTLRIAERCELDIGLGAFHFPAASVPRGETPYSVLSKLAWRGLEERYRPMIPEAVRRLSHELSVIQDLGFPEYFLIVHEIVSAARERGIRCTGRGSAGDSIVTYALGITDADPVAHDLLFERFLNPQRRQMPDIDVDFDSARRDEVIDFIYDRFGRDRVAMVATVNCMTAKGAVRTAARALGHPPKMLDELSRYLPWTSMPPREAIRAFPECEHHPLHDEGRFGLLLDLADELVGTLMHLGTHLGGFIITKEPIDSWTPLQWAAKGVVVSQYDKDDVEALGLVKMDILGLRMHSAISDAVEMARARVGDAAVPEPFTLPKDDPEVYDMIAAADTVGVFQLESSGQRNLARRLRQRDFEDIISAISLFRPGPMEADMVNPFIRRRHGIDPVVLPHPSMARAVGDTYGVIIYQEQVLRVAEAVAGFDLAEADSLRRAMTKDRSKEEMEAIGEHFIERAVARGVPDAAAREVFRQLKGFAAYGFNKAHGACFAVISYGSAWLKHYFPAEFAAAILDNEPMGFYTPRCVLSDACRAGIEALPIHVNASDSRCTVQRDGRAIRVGLAYVSQLTKATRARLLEERAVRPFLDLADFMRRVRPEAPEAINLVRVGALDGLGTTDAARPPTRDEMLALVPELKAVIAREGVAGDAPMVVAPSRARDPDPTGHPSGWSEARRLSAELEFTGLAITCHPLEIGARELEREGVTWARDLPGKADGARVRIAGLRERALTPYMRSGKRTCFLTMEDHTGLLDVAVFSDTLARIGDTIVKNRAYVVEGTLQNNTERGITVIARTIEPLTIRAEGREPVRLRGSVFTGPLGDSKPGLGAEEVFEEEQALM